MTRRSLPLFTLYLTLACQAPLLNAQEESTLQKAVNNAMSSATQKDIDTIQNYYQAIQDYPPTSRQQAQKSPQQTSEKVDTPSKPALSQRQGFKQMAFPPQLNEQAAPIKTTGSHPINYGDNHKAAAFTLAGRDPFALTPNMLDNENFSLRKNIEFTPLGKDYQIPKMRLKGIINDPKQEKMAALLEIEGLGVFVVREGDNVGLHGIGNGRDVIQIEQISRLSLTVLTGTYSGTEQKRFVIR